MAQSNRRTQSKLEGEESAIDQMETLLGIHVEAIEDNMLRLEYTSIDGDAPFQVTVITCENIYDGTCPLIRSVL